MASRLMLVVSLAAMVAFGGCNCPKTVQVKGAPKNVGGTQEGRVSITGEYESYETVIKTKKDLMISVSRATADAGDHDADFVTLYMVPEVVTDALPVRVHNPDAMVQLQEGWGVWSGQYPMGETKRARVIGQGTEFVISIEASVDYVLDLAKSGHNVQVIAVNSMEKKLLTPGEYCTVDDMGHISTPAPISSNADMAALAGKAEALLAEIQ